MANPERQRRGGTEQHPVADAPGSPRVASLVAAGLLFAFALYQALFTDWQRDFFIFRLGSELAARGNNPYDLATVKRLVAEHFTDDETKEFRENCGYFLPPLGVLVFLPFAMLPWVAAKALWAVVLGIAAYFIARLPERLPSANSSGPRGLIGAALPFVLVLNFVTLGSVLIGQYTVLFVGAVAAGLLAFDRGKPYLAAAVWVLPFVKPHLALTLIPLAWFLGGWRPALLLVALVGVLNLAGAAVAGGSPLFLKEYFEYLPTAREAVKYNRVEFNPTMLSWNRLLYAAGGPLVELGAVGIAAGYLVWYGLAAGRCGLADVVPSRAWAAAVAAVGGLLCAQVMVYESLLLLVLVPWVRDLFAGGYGLRGGLAIGLMATQLVPQAAAARFGVGAHHPLAVALLAVLVLVGPTDPAGGRR